MRNLVTEVQTPTVRFVGEQDGPIERDLKAKWLLILANSPQIRRAFLVRATYADQTQHVILALASTGGPDLTLVEALRVPYAALFSRDCPLDMTFVGASQQSDIEKVCPPFYTAV
jgi:hypothetical protein